MSKSKTKKLLPMHPGEILQKHFMAEHGLSVKKLASALRMPPTRISEIVNGRRSVTADAALRLAHYFHTTPEFWLNLQVRFELAVAENKRAKIDKAVRPISAPA